MGLLAAGCGIDAGGVATPAPAATSATNAYPVPDLLVDASWLRARLDDPSLRLVDCASLSDYRRGHIPGARHIWWQDTIEVNNPVYGMLVGRAGRDPLLRAAGVAPETTVVVYDRSGGTYAARLLWMLQVDGFRGARLLDGGLHAWRAAGGATTREEPAPGAGGLPATPNEEILAHAHDIVARLGTPGLCILDTRTTDERKETWNGKLRHGSLPGSVWLPRDRFLATGPVPYLLAPNLLRARLRQAGAPADIGGSEFIVYGLHGTLAALPWLALTALGAGKARVYDGSWSEWGADPTLPIDPLPG